jgi:hypothetical protein
MMTGASIHNNQTPADECYDAPSPTTSLSPTLVDNTHYTQTRFRFPGGASNILNSTFVDDITDQSFYSTSSDSKSTKLVSCGDNVEIAAIQWDHHSPRMVFRGNKMKCKDWLKLAGPDSEYMLISLM